MTGDPQPDDATAGEKKSRSATPAGVAESDLSDPGDLLADPDVIALFADADRAAEADRHPDDIGNAHRLIDQHGSALRHVPELRSWFYWDGICWVRDVGDVQASERAKATARSILAEADRASGSTRRKKLRDHASRAAHASRLAAMLRVAATDPAVSVTVSRLDADPWLLCTPSGTVDLRTGDRRTNHPTDLITRRTRVGYQRTADAPLFEAFLARMLPDDDVRAYVQRLLGYALIGIVHEHVLPVFHGTGANGKTTLLVVVRYVLGDYAHTGSVDLVIASRRDVGAATPELVELRGRRLVAVDETGEGGRLAAERVKQITGGGMISARGLYADPIEFKPSHQLVLSTNHKPRIPDDGEAIWRRLHLVPFGVTIPPREIDPALGDKLQDEAAGILAWLVRGALDYGERGLDPPAAVISATREYRESEDRFGEFLTEQATLDPDGWTATAAITAAYQAWAKARGDEPLSSQAVSERLKALAERLPAGQLSSERQRHQRRDQRGWRGIRLLDDQTLLDQGAAS